MYIVACILFIDQRIPRSEIEHARAELLREPFLESRGMR